MEGATGITVVTLVAETIDKGAVTKGVIGIACSITGGLGGRGWGDLTARTSYAGMGRGSVGVSINKLGMAGQWQIFLKSSNSPCVT